MECCRSRADAVIVLHPEAATFLLFRIVIMEFGFSDFSVPGRARMQVAFACVLPVAGQQNIAGVSLRQHIYVKRCYVSGISA